MPRFEDHPYLYFGLWLTCLIGGMVVLRFKYRKKFRKVKRDKVFSDMDKMIEDMIEYSEKPAA